MSPESLQIQYAERIALLSFLKPDPDALCSTFPPPVKAGIRTDGFLTLEHERHLTGTLAFLADISNHHDHILAVAVEEIVHWKELRVLIAINKKTPTAGDNVRERAKQGFESIFSILKDVSAGGLSSVKEVFKAVVRLCEASILRRMRSGRTNWQTNRGKEKQFIGLTLRKIIDVVTRSRNIAGLAADERRSFLSGSEELQEALDEFERRENDSAAAVPLIAIVQKIYRYNKTLALERVLGGIRAEEIQERTRTGFLNHIQEIARYRQASNYLWKLARKNHLFGNVNVFPISLDPAYFQREDHSAYVPDLKASFSSEGAEVEGRSLESACQLLKVSQNLAEADFVVAVGTNLRAAKVHAEIQIALFLDLHPPKNPPRVICSSKDACYLCNAFMRLHGKFETPNSHGKLYPNWRLPTQACSSTLGTDFSHLLREEIRHHLELLHKRRRKHPDHGNKEQTLGSLPPSTISLPSTRTLRGSSSESSQISETSQRTIVPGSAGKVQSGPSTSGLAERRLSRSDEELYDSTPPPEQDSRLPVRLVKGETYRTKTTQDRSSLCYRTSLLEIFIEFESGTSRTPAIVSQVEWLQSQEDQERSTSRSRTFDIASLPIGRDVDTGTWDCLYLSSGEDVAKIQLHRE